ncbi:hypothetical protein CS063_05995 [Sporanaerobium hydrogeniformans]|uniref:Uncharacterized protein n=1 Tax=Sporanaerobium hydrogeniformans TaxID=3072179 RepID=A0AC61DEW6_9FIRM|nr:rhomboid family intramembrane serine protease [Sporanaerobium hydrogeniformans]PHV71241.1 hypothetical protein CS063_05995 [Sporanaerobium hydrogeniformans]
MNFLDKMERKWGRFAIPNLMLYILLGNGIVFLLYHLMGPQIEFLLAFNWQAVLHGQVWRLITFIFIPNSYSIIWFIFMAFLYYSIGSALEHAWGTFKFNVYYFTGALLTMIASGVLGGFGTTYYINLSLFLAYATLFPNVQFLLYGLIPVKVKYLAYLDVALLLFEFIQQGLAGKALIIISLFNYILFFGSTLTRGRQTATQKQFNKTKRAQSSTQRHYKSSSSEPIQVAFHKCHICGKTELTHPDMDFRYCSKCNGNYEYCMEHLKNHTHVE